MLDATHPADELGAIITSLGVLKERESELRRELIANRERRVGERYYATVVRMAGADLVTLDPLPDLVETHRLLSGPVLVADCETTGLHAYDGDRMVSLGLVPGQVGWTCILGRGDSHEPSFNINHGEVYLCAFNPDRASSPEAFEVHGLSDERLATCRRFGDRAREIEDILLGDEDGPPVIVAHNAPFDMGFIRAEFSIAGINPNTGNTVVDTRIIAKMLWPDEPATLDALATRLGVDRSRRAERHYAYGDAWILGQCLPGLAAAIAARIEAQTSKEVACG